jgi:signal transduction histidine kinase
VAELTPRQRSVLPKLKKPVRYAGTLNAALPDLIASVKAHGASSTLDLPILTACTAAAVRPFSGQGRGRTGPRSGPALCERFRNPTNLSPPHCVGFTDRAFAPLNPLALPSELLHALKPPVTDPRQVWQHQHLGWGEMMNGNTVASHGLLASHSNPRLRHSARTLWSAALERCGAVVTSEFLRQVLIAFAAYYIAAKLGQTTTSIRSGNLGPVWPASGIALAAVLAYGYRVWPGVAAGCFLAAYQSPVFVLTAAGQAAGATLAAVVGAFLLRRRDGFDPALSRLRDALALIILGAFGSAILSASIGVSSLYATGLKAYSDLASAWLIYWLGDATGVLLVTPLVFTLPALMKVRSRTRLVELAVLLVLVMAACVLIFGDLPLVPIRLHVLAFAVVPLVMWAAIDFGIGGASLSVFLIATAATLLTAMGSGPFSVNTPFVNAALLDVLFTVLAVSGLALAAVIAERERAETERERLIRAQTAMEAREEALSAVSRRLIDAQEQERRRIARELHDDIGQRLALLTVNLRAVAEEAGDSPRFQRQAIEVERKAAEIAADIQTLSHRLHSSTLELLGVRAAIQHFCEEFADQQSAVVHFDSDDLPGALPRDIALCLFRIVQEALHNAVKHSGVRQFAVRLWGTPGHVGLVVSDRGKGFDVAAARAGQGLGLISMEERIKLVDGDLSIDSQPGQGTRIHARVPFSSSPAPPVS